MRDQVHRVYEARIDNAENIYDGDTINKVYFKLPIEIETFQYDFGEIYPEIFLHKDGVWVHVNVRLDGIDTPERHPHHKYPDGTARSDEELSREHALAMQARQEVVNILKANDLKFEIRNPQEGKYAGRVVAEVWVTDPELGRMINLSEHLIDKGLGYPYEGGTKRVWGRY